MRAGFRHERFEEWRRERHALTKPNAPAMAPWVTLDIDETVALFLADVPEARVHTMELTAYLQARYPHGVHVRSNTTVASPY